MAFSVVLARECFAAYGAHKRSFVGMRSQVRTKIISACKPLRTEITLKCGGMFLNSLGVTILEATR